MNLPRCAKCGLPRHLSSGYVWPGNGTVFSRRDPQTRMVIFESEYYPYLWNELQERLGVEISETYIRGQKASVLDYLGKNVLYGWRLALVRKLPFSFVIGRIIRILSLFGFGRLEFVEYRRGRLVLLRLTNPFDILSLAWGVKGFSEMVNNFPFEVGWVREEDGYLLTASRLPPGREGEPLDEKAVAAMRRAKEELAEVKADFEGQGMELRRCPRCRLPEALTRLEWKEEDGAIYNRADGKRMIFSTGYVMVGIVNELERVTGERLERHVLEITKNYHLKGLRGMPERERADAYRELFFQLSAWGYGLPLQYSFGAGHLEATIGNPFYVPRLLGNVAAVFESLEGQESEITYRRPQPYLLELEIKTA